MPIDYICETFGIAMHIPNKLQLLLIQADFDKSLITKFNIHENKTMFFFTRYQID